MAHMAKFSRGSVPRMIAHYDRDESIQEYGNEMIDKSKTGQNYDLHAQSVGDGKKSWQRYKDCMEDVYCLNRKDVNTMVDWVITLPKDFKGSPEEFFNDCYYFLKDRYQVKGSELYQIGVGGIKPPDNIICASVHMDETTPHMHFSFVPLEKTDKYLDLEYKVNAKKVVNRTDLQSFHKDLESHLHELMGHDIEIGILNGATKEGNKSKKELLSEEIRQKQEQVKALREQADYNKLITRSNVLEEENKDLREQVNSLQVENGSLKVQIADLRQSIENKVKQMAEPLEEQIQGFKEALQSMAETTRSVVRSVSWIDKKFKNDELHKVCEAVQDYGRIWLSKDGFEELADTADEPILSKGIKSLLTPDYQEIAYYKGSNGYGWYASKAEGGEYLGNKKETLDIRKRFPNARFKDPHDLTDLNISALNKGIMKTSLNREL